MHAAPKVAFTPKGGCPLKPKERPTSPSKARPCSIHPQGWVPIETLVCGWPSPAPSGDGSSIHPQGWVPIETEGAQVGVAERVAAVAFTPKGGCPLKPVWFACTNWRRPKCSIHPQGWVPIETLRFRKRRHGCPHLVSAHAVDFRHGATAAPLLTSPVHADKGTSVRHRIAEAGAIFPAWA